MAIELKTMTFLGKNRDGEVGPEVKVEIEKLSSILTRLEEITVPKPWNTWKEVMLAAHATHTIERQNESRNQIGANGGKTKRNPSKYD